MIKYKVIYKTRKYIGKTPRMRINFHWLVHCLDNRWYKYPRYKFLRHMRTTQERRENDFVDYDEDCLDSGVKVRGRRRKRSLPTAWEDKFFQPRKSWKMTTKKRKQWK